MWPDYIDKVILRQDYRRAGSAAPIYLLSYIQDGLAWLYPEDRKRWQFPAHSNPHMLVPPIHQQVPINHIRKLSCPVQDEFIESVRLGKYRKAKKLLVEHPMVDPFGHWDKPTIFLAQEIDNTARRRSVMRLLMSQGVSPETLHDLKDDGVGAITPLHHAVKKSFFDSADDLVALTNPFSKNDLLSKELTDLSIANKNFEALGWLATHRASISLRLEHIEKLNLRFDPANYQQNLYSGCHLPPLHVLALARFENPDYFVALFELLIKQGCQMGRVDHNGATAMDVALAHGTPQAQAGAARVMSQFQARQLHECTPTIHKQHSRRSL